MSETPSAQSNKRSGSENVSRLLLRLDPDLTCAWEKHEDIRRKLVKFFEWNRSLFAEELADEALGRVEKKLESEEIHDIASYALGVARYVLLESNKKKRESFIEDRPGGSDSIADPRDRERELVEEVDHQIRLSCLRQCLDSLRPDERELAIGYYSAEHEKQNAYRQNIAKTIGITIIALRVRTNRIREKLEKCVNERLYGRRRMLKSAWEQRLGL